jgi:hypothetical protein
VDKTVEQLYLRDLVALVHQRATESKRIVERSVRKSSRDIEWGRMRGYAEVLALMQHQAETFGLSADELGLSGIDPDNDFS